MPTTLLVTRTTLEMHKILHRIEEHSEYYNLALNRKKCEVLEMSGEFNIKFKSGEPMPKVEYETYLGAKKMQKKQKKKSRNQKQIKILFLSPKQITHFPETSCSSN